MEKKFGRNKAGHTPSNKAVTMIVSILAVTLFIGTAMQPIMAGPVSNSNPEPVEVEEECLPCKAAETTSKNPPCESCACAVNYAVDYMVIFVTANVKDYKFPLWRAELVGLIFEGIVTGVIESGFGFHINEKELKAHINYWIDKLIEPENYRYKINEILANIYAIGVGISSYLSTICNNNVAQSLPAPTQQTPSVSKIILIFYMWIKILHLLGL